MRGRQKYPASPNYTGWLNMNWTGPRRLYSIVIARRDLRENISGRNILNLNRETVYIAQLL